MSTTTATSTAPLEDEGGWQSYEELMAGVPPKDEYRPYQQFLDEQAQADAATEDEAAEAETEAKTDEPPAQEPEQKAVAAPATKEPTDIEKLAAAILAGMSRNGAHPQQQAAPAIAPAEDQFAEPQFTFDEKEVEKSIRAELEAELRAEQIKAHEYETETVRGEDGEEINVVKFDANGEPILKPLSAREKYQFDQTVKARVAQAKLEAMRAHQDAVAETRLRRHYHDMSTEYARGLVYDALPSARVGEGKIDARMFASIGPTIRGMIHGAINARLEQFPGKTMAQVFPGRDINETIEKATEYGAGVIKFLFDEIRKSAAPAAGKQPDPAVAKQPETRAVDAPKAATTYAGVMAKVMPEKKIAATPSAPQNATTVAAKPTVSAMSIVAKMMAGSDSAVKALKQVERGDVAVRFATPTSPFTTTTTTKKG
jgi:hypothetical protein